MGKLSRRELMVGVTATLGGCFGVNQYGQESRRQPFGGSQNMNNMIESGLVEQLHVEPTEDDLPTPPRQTPAVGVTNDGMFEWTGDSKDDEWIPFSYGTEENPLPEVHGEMGNFERVLGVNRRQELQQANQIRARAGVPASQVTGIRSGHTADITGSLSSDSRIVIDNEGDGSSTDVQTHAASGSGTESNPYVIKDKRLDNSEATSARAGFYWNDPDANYYIELKNCWISGYQDGQVWVDSGLEDSLTIQNCRLNSGGVSSSYGLRMQTGGAVVKDTLFAGCTASGILSGGKGVTLRDVAFDASQESWGGEAIFVSSAGVDARYIDAQASGLTQFLKVNIDAKSVVRNAYIRDCARAVYINNPAERPTDVTLEYVDVANTSQENVRVQDAEGVTIRYSRFADSAAGERGVYFASNCSDSLVEWCEFTMTNGSGATNECLQADASEDIEFRYCYTTECPEDAYEFVDSNNCTIHHVVADNCSGQIVDYFRGKDGAGTDAGGYVHHVYGDCGDRAVRITDADGVECHDVYARAASGGVILEQRNASSGSSPDNCTVYGGLPVPEVCNETPFETGGDVGSNNTVYYHAGEFKNPLGTPPQTEVR